MPFCTIVEFEWDSSEARAAFEKTMAAVAAASPRPAGRVSRIVGIDEGGARVVEVWESGQAAAAYAEKTGPVVSGAALPTPVRVVAFEVTEYERS